MPSVKFIMKQLPWSRQVPAACLVLPSQEDEYPGKARSHSAATRWRSTLRYVGQSVESRARFFDFGNDGGFSEEGNDELERRKQASGSWSVVFHAFPCCIGIRGGPGEEAPG
jgi:hypothetical protein